MIALATSQVAQLVLIRDFGSERPLSESRLRETE